VYDLMEPLRPLVDRLVLDFVRSQTFPPSDFVLRDDGVCRLHPQLAREAAARLARDDRVMREVVDRFVQELRVIATLRAASVTVSRRRA
jgi:CRISPR-associated protein Cas1